ncbi:hypothetical protein E1A91_A12G139300v1 [Gossypium mustelinum]|uniref:Uncharacterized protein n=1 Tax=Gossypium mustelinum TaxID=34275 RepID=A0A5D2WTZ9_GOSMU|nr:hypothetical protein E1A91_A12G139300v1 [Gossypium mustelinum]
MSKSPIHSQNTRTNFLPPPQCCFILFLELKPVLIFCFKKPFNFCFYKKKKENPKCLVCLLISLTLPYSPTKRLVPRPSVRDQRRPADGASTVRLRWRRATWGMGANVERGTWRSYVEVLVLRAWKLSRRQQWRKGPLP